MNTNNDTITEEQGRATMGKVIELLETIPEGDKLHGLAGNVVEILRLALDRTAPPTFAYYTDEGIWSTGATPEEAIESYLQDARADREDFGEMKTAPMTPRLARQVERHGFDCKYDSYTILKDGRLDKVEPSDAYTDEEPHTEVTSI